MKKYFRAILRFITAIFYMLIANSFVSYEFCLVFSFEYYETVFRVIVVLWLILALCIMLHRRAKKKIEDRKRYAKKYVFDDTHIFDTVAEGGINSQIDFDEYEN